MHLAKAGILGGAALLMIGAALPVAPASQHSRHQLLVDKINEVASFEINAEVCWENPGIMGAYNYFENSLYICNPKAETLADLNEEDLDTIRHEAIHLAQDCVSGGIGSKTTALFFSDRKVEEMVEEAEEKGLIDADGIVRSYQMIGASDDDIEHELEAWSGAALLSAGQVVEIVDLACSR